MRKSVRRKSYRRKVRKTRGRRKSNNKPTRRRSRSRKYSKKKQRGGGRVLYLGSLTPHGAGQRGRGHPSCILRGYGFQ